MRILLVDDDSGVVQALLAILKQLPGQEIRVAMNGEKALENAATLGGVDLLITDVVMDPMDGFTLRDQLLGRYPNMRTILISGYDLSEYPEQTQHHQVLAKPVEPGALIAAVKKESDSPATSVAAVVKAAAAQPNAVEIAPTVKVTPTVIARPVAQSGTGPRAVPAGRGVPAAVPTPANTPTVRMQAIPAPQPRAAGPGAVPQARAMATSPVSTSQARAAAPEPAGGNSLGESLIGQTLGSYQIVSFLGDGRNGSAYAAVQISINRPVGLKVMNPDLQRDEAARARFIADARAKAHVQHPAILAVYEAGESDGRIFYAREYVDGQSLAEVQASGQCLDEPAGIKVMRTVAEGLAYLRLHNIPHRAIEPGSIFVGVDGHPRLANLAMQINEEAQSIELQIQALARIMLSVMPGAQLLSTPVRTLLARAMQAPTSGMNSWGVLLQGLKALEPKAAPIEAGKISAQDRAAIEAVEAARKQQRKGFWLTITSLTVTFGLVVWLILWKFVFTNERKIQEMIKVPAGTYKTPSGKTVTIDKEFEIDKYEVTWGQYALFLDYLDKHPTADQEFRHPRMPRYLNHRPEYWSIYYGQARAGGAAHKVPIDLNCPAVTVTWWDAYAYARWLGRELPSEDEWEVAASGGTTQRYPWGNDIDPKKANSAVDHDPNHPEAKGKTDGYNFWNPVDAIRSDRSPFGVVGMAGNVSEWTNTWTTDNRFPIIKGGSFVTPDVNIDRRIDNHEPGKGEEFIGFRTISRTSPQAEK
jgi:formylglycine-generating enzyme required for sulfatase activity/CheY-like chemotaxis protein